MATSADISKAAADRALLGMLEEITDTLQKGETVTLVGFGTFSTSERSARTGTNPQTGKAIEIPELARKRYKEIRG
jgi:DNA-binding protein HU-beta